LLFLKQSNIQAHYFEVLSVKVSESNEVYKKQMIDMIMKALERTENKQITIRVGPPATTSTVEETSYS
jgi:tRNA nucleotidyltransferase (CCA-adding enzyme)